MIKSFHKPIVFHTAQQRLFLPFFTLLVLLCHTGSAQQLNWIDDLSIQLDSGAYSWQQNRVQYSGDRYLAFKYDERNEIARVRLYPKRGYFPDSISLLPSQDYELLDSLILINGAYYEFKVQFKDLARSDFLSFTFNVKLRAETFAYRVPLYHYSGTAVAFGRQDTELFIGEEKSFELLVQNPENIKTSSIWQKQQSLEYRLLEREGKIFLHVVPNETGTHTLSFAPNLKRPLPSGAEGLVYQLPQITVTFQVKESRLAFLSLVPQEVIFSQEAMSRGVEVEISNHPQLQLNKTYRIEAQEQPGGPLVAELFTRSLLANDRVLCWLRVYQYHNPTEGYLYLKSADEAVFISNFAISPKTKVNAVSIMRDGLNWSSDLSIYPGEIIDVKIEGVGLEKANFKFEGLFKVLSDSAINNDNLQIFTLKIPITIYKKAATLYNHGEPTGYALKVKEFQQPHPLEFIQVDLGAGPVPITDFKTMILHYEPLQDIIFTFNRDMIDSRDKLFGKQYLTFDIKITGPRRELIDLKTIERIEVTPSTSSPRYRYYNRDKALKGPLYLKNYISTKLSDLPEWAKVEIVIKHNSDYYGDGGFEHKLEIYMARKSSFDIDVSFPAGLLTQDLGGDGEIRTFGGISLAAIAQFKFYKPESVAKTRPYRIGAGVLAINSFNLGDNSDRDLALVAIGSVYPLNKDGSRLSFPLHMGMGYKWADGRFFFLVGPGIRVRF